MAGPDTRTTGFLAELYVSAHDEHEAAQLAERAKGAAAAMAREGVAVRYVRSIFVPADETCFLVLEAQSASVVADLARQAQLPLNRISEATGDP